MQAFIEPLLAGLLAYAEGAIEHGSAIHRRKVARRLTGGYAEGLDRISESIEHISERLGATPNSISFDIGAATHLRGHLDGFTNALSLYLQGRLKPHQVAEEAHTALEILMKEALGSASHGQSFAAMVRLAAARDYFPTRIEGPLISLKDYRRSAKHKGQGISHQVIDRLLPPVLEASHQLTRIIRRAY